MKYSSWLKKDLIFLILFANNILSATHGRRYDKCETADGRQGVCVVKRYCREATSQSLLACDDDDNFCCPIPTQTRSAKPPIVLPQIPQRTQITNNPENASVVNNYPEHKPYEVPERSVQSQSESKHEVLPNYPIRSGVSKPQSENDRRFGTSYPKAKREQHQDDYENKRISQVPELPKPDKQSKDQLDQTNSAGRVKFEDSSYISPSHHRKNSSNGETHRFKSPEPKHDLNKAVHPSETRREIASSDKQSEDASREVFDRNRNKYPDSQASTVSHFPAKDQFEVQKLPSNPRRLRPLRFDRENETDGSILRDHILYPDESSLPQPKVPACGVKPYDLFIAGGVTSEAYEWPWMTAIFRRHQGSRPKTFLCGGSLINTKYVLTAAHCFVNNYVVLPASSFVVRLGSHYLDSGEEYTVAELFIHHNHSGADFFNDIALVRIASEVYITDKIAPICLPSQDMITFDFVGRLATVAGWGDTAFRTGASRALQHVTIPIVSSEECFAAYSRVRGAAFLARGSDHVICAGLREGGKDACLGDSGGPLMLKTVDDRWIIVGIVSLGYKCAEPGYPGVYTRVTHYLSWIKNNMKNY